MNVNILAPVQESLTTLEENLQLPKGFLYKLLEEDDWSFVIKCNCIIESALNEVIAEPFQVINEEGLRSFLDKLPMGGPIGKAGLAHRLNAIAKEDAIFIESIIYQKFHMYKSWFRPEPYVWGADFLKAR
jgi:hypothetical protein